MPGILVIIYYYYTAGVRASQLPPQRWEPHQSRGVNEGTKGRGWAVGSGAGAEPRGGEPNGRAHITGSAGGNALGFLYGLIFSEEDFTACVKNLEKQW